VPVTVLQTSSSALQERQSTDIHPSYKGTVLFRNVFDGELAATDYPKVNVCDLYVNLQCCMTRFVVLLRHVSLIHCIGGRLGLAMLQACYRNSSHTGKIYDGPVTMLLDSLRIVLSLLSHWLPHSRNDCQFGYVFLCPIHGRSQIILYQAYYRYLNAHGKNTASTVFLFVVAILDAGRNSLSFFMLLVVSLGLSVVRDDLGPTMRKAQILSGAHFVFGGSTSPLRAPESQLRHFYSPVRRRHCRARV
jgi:Lung seven transmembrane receptor